MENVHGKPSFPIPVVDKHGESLSASARIFHPFPAFSHVVFGKEFSERIYAVFPSRQCPGAGIYAPFGQRLASVPSGQGPNGRPGPILPRYITCFYSPKNRSTFQPCPVSG